MRQTAIWTSNCCRIHGRHQVPIVRAASRGHRHTGARSATQHSTALTATTLDASHPDSSKTRAACSKTRTQLPQPASSSRVQPQQHQKFHIVKGSCNQGRTVLAGCWPAVPSCKRVRRRQQQAGTAGHPCSGFGAIPAPHLVAHAARKGFRPSWTIWAAGHAARRRVACAAMRPVPGTPPPGGAFKTAAALANGRVREPHAVVRAA